MPTRDTWTVDLRCPCCGASSDAHVSQDEHPFKPATGTLTVDHLPAGFRVRKLGSTMRTTQFECIRCGTLTQR